MKVSEVEDKVIILDEDFTLQSSVDPIEFGEMRVVSPHGVGDLMLVFKEERGDFDKLCDDEVLEASVMAKLKELGFEGEPFGRSELGRQWEWELAYEGGDDFREWLKEKWGWVDLMELEDDED